MNLTYNPATGANYPFSRHQPAVPFPEWGIGARRSVMIGRSNYHGWENGVHQALQQPVAGERDLRARRS